MDNEYVPCILSVEKNCIRDHVKFDDEKKEYRTCGFCIIYQNIMDKNFDVTEMNIYVKDNIQITEKLEELNSRQIEKENKKQEIEKDIKNIRKKKKSIISDMITLD